MQLTPIGRLFGENAPLAPAVEEREFGEAVLRSLEPNAPDLAGVTQTTRRAVAFRDALEQELTPELAHPKAVGWTFLVSTKDPHRDEVERILRRLSEHRNDPKKPREPLVLDPDEDWSDWIEKRYLGLGQEKRPYYVMLVGGPELIPFGFQSRFNVAAAVGRAAFDSLDDLAVYVDKVIRLESEPVAAAECLFIAPDDIPPTGLSRRRMVQPLIGLAEAAREGKWTVHSLLGEEATKTRVREELGRTKAALIYSASHGQLAPKDQYPLEVSKRVNGALLCQDAGDGDALFAAEDVPDEPFLEGAVYFQFACFGYGTPALSGFWHWGRREVPRENAEADFVAALPKRLLAHPRGPIAFIGHLDVAWVHGFDDPDNPQLISRWSERLEPFRTAMRQLLGLRPPGLAMRDFSLRFNDINGDLTDLIDERKQQAVPITEEQIMNLATQFLIRGDAKNYHVMGDPAVATRVR